MTTRFTAANAVLELTRYPATSQDPLQAWDAADEHLLQHIADSALLPRQKVLLVNDGFGALTCALRSANPALAINFAADGRIAHLGCRENLARNGLSEDGINFHGCNRLGSLAKDALVLVKLPKNLNFFIDTLCQLSQGLQAGDTVLIGAKAKHINASLLASIKQHLGDATASLAWKKTRVITVIADGKVRAVPQPRRWPVTEYKLMLQNDSNVFAANKLDIGARLMLAHLPDGDFSEVIDLGCGNGVLGLRAASCYPNAKIHFVDESLMAVDSARINWQQNGLEDSRSDFHWDDCLSHLPPEVQADLVLCNPPFHQGEAITDHIAWQMFNDARRRLRPGGLLHIVGNRHLGYHVKLKRLFGNCKTIASNGKFVILQSVKQ